MGHTEKISDYEMGRAWTHVPEPADGGSEKAAEPATEAEPQKTQAAKPK